MRLNILTRKTLGGLETDARLPGACGPTATPFPGLYAAGEVAGFGGGGVHGYNALEGTFLGGCIFSGRAAGRALAAPCRRVRSRRPGTGTDMAVLPVILVLLVAAVAGYLLRDLLRASRSSPLVGDEVKHESFAHLDYPVPVGRTPPPC